MNRKTAFSIVVIISLTIIGVFEAKANNVRLNSTANNLSSILLPMIIKQKQSSSQAGTPSGALLVFFSNETTTGNAGGRVAMNAICSNTDPASFFCSKELIENAIQTSGVYFDTPVSEVGFIDIVFSVTEGRFYWDSGSCYGWTSDSPGVDGGRIFNGGVLGGRGQNICDKVNKVACCKWIP